MFNNPRVPWRDITIYFVLACALLWIPFFGVMYSGKDGADPGAWGVAMGILGPYSPLIAALIVRTLVARDGFRDAHLGLRVHWYWWVLALLLPFFWNSVQDAMQLGLGFATINWAEMTRGLYRVPINLLAGILILFGEEFGWRSYLVEKLRPLGRWNALLLSGIFWAAWHVPLVFTPNTVTSYGLQMSVAGSLLALFNFVLFGFIFGWLYLESNSVWPCALMHAYNNLIALKLFREAWTVTTAPDLLQNNLIAVGPILLVWLILYARGAFKAPEAAVLATAGTGA